MATSDRKRTIKYLCLALAEGIPLKKKIQFLVATDINTALKKCNSVNKIKVKKALQWLDESNNNHIIDFYDPHYPQQLKHIDTPPLVLFCKGDISLLNNNSVAIIGSRIAQEYSHKVAFKFSKFFINIGIPIISGLARGIDTTVAKSSVASNVATIAVIGSGIDISYPHENKKIQADITKHGLIISEYPPGTLPYPYNFPKRNRIISALAMGICVIEARLKSGSLITANLALDYGKEVFIVPGHVTDDSYLGSHKLIQDGAKLVHNPQDIIDDLPFLLKNKT